MMNKVYLHDGSADGILTAIAAAFAGSDAEQEFSASNKWNPSFFTEEIQVTPDSSVAENFLRIIETDISAEAAKSVFYCVLSEKAGIEKAILSFVKFGMKTGRDVHKHHADPRVIIIREIGGKVRKEIHTLKGLLRFRELENGILWAPVKPDYNVILPVSFHFKKRLGGEKWIIHDFKRNIAVIWNGEILKYIKNVKKSFAGRLPDAGGEMLSGNEKNYQSLWREYFKRIAISDRANPKLQRQNMPRRYWEYLVEL